MKNLCELLDQAAELYRDQIFSKIRDGETWRALSFRQLRDSAEALARGMHAAGIRAGDRVAILSENRPEWGIAFFALLRLDAVIVPLDKLLKAEEIAEILSVAKPKFAIVSKSYLELMAGISNHPPIISLDNLSGVMEDGLRENPVPGPGASTDSVAVIIFTSGTTGNPKGVMLTHGNFLSNVESFTQIFPERFFRKNFVSMLPLNHAYELTGGFFTPLFGGGTVTYLDSLKPARLLETMREAESEIMLTVPAFLEMLQANVLQQVHRSRRNTIRFRFAFQLASMIPGRAFRRLIFRDLHAAFGGKLGIFVSGGAPLSPEVQTFFERLGFEVLQGYGLTETAPVLTVNPLHHAKINSVGKAVPGVEIIISPSGTVHGGTVPEGEILAKGPNVMQGYYENPEATHEMFKNGYFATGDLGHFDSNGYLYITGRSKNVIIHSSGKNVFPEEIEEKLKRIPYIKEVCVLGRKKGIGETVAAVVVPDFDKLKADGITSGEVRGRIWNEIRKVNASMADFKRVHDLILWEGELPKTTTMKVKRRELLTLLETNALDKADSGPDRVLKGP